MFLFPPEEFCCFLAQNLPWRIHLFGECTLFSICFAIYKVLSCILFLFSLVTVVKYMYYHYACRWETCDSENFTNSTKVREKTKAKPSLKPRLAAAKASVLSCIPQLPSATWLGFYFISCVPLQSGIAWKCILKIKSLRLFSLFNMLYLGTLLWWCNEGRGVI